jgi:hypothetical protein
MLYDILLIVNSLSDDSVIRSSVLTMNSIGMLLELDIDGRVAMKDYAELKFVILVVINSL